MSRAFGVFLCGVLSLTVGFPPAARADEQTGGAAPASTPTQTAPRPAAPPAPISGSGPFAPGAAASPASESPDASISPLPAPPARQGNPNPPTSLTDAARFFDDFASGRRPIYQPLYPTGWDLPRSETALRFGWWGATHRGSPMQVGEYQSLNPSPFWDIDTIRSDGFQTLDLWASQLDNDANTVRSHYYRNGFLADVDFTRFLRRWDHDPLHGGTPQSNNQVVSEDLNLGQDYAIRVDMLKANFKEQITNNIAWRLNLWGIRKFGERQANSMAHCFNMNFGGRPADNRCHVLSQRQMIDWLTMEIEPGLVANFGRVTVDYARTMRQFTQNDQTVFRPFTQFGPFGGSNVETVFPYAIVPNSLFQMDRLKISADLTKKTRLYTYLYNGDMFNEDRETHRRFRGFDARLINSSPSGVTWTAYAKMFDTDNQLPPFLLPEEQIKPNGILHPVDYTSLWTGIDGQWFPTRYASPRWQGLTFRGGYEYHAILRGFATYPTNLESGFVPPPTVTHDTIQASQFTQPTTQRHEIKFGPWMRWDSGVVTYLRYRFRFTQDPLFGLTPPSGVLNSNMPTQDNIVELGGSWSPMQNLLMSAQVSFQNTRLVSQFASFSENNYPVNATIWYAPTKKWSVSAGYNFFSNLVGQDVTFGFRGMDEPPPAETLRVAYRGISQVLNVGTRYAWSDRLVFNGGIVWTDGSNLFTVPPSQTGADWSLLPLVSGTIARTLRYQAGVDYRLTRNVASYFRFNFFDFANGLNGVGTGTAYFFMGGVNAVF